MGCGVRIASFNYLSRIGFKLGVVRLQVIVKQGDTLQSLALEYLGNAAQDNLLASVNNLEYPFIVQDPNFQKLIYASGNLNVTYTGTSTPYTLSIGSIFQTPASTQEGIRSYATTSQADFTSTNQMITVPIQCTIAGSFGNTLAGQVSISPDNSQLVVSNPSSVIGGRIWRVLVPGDFITIPEPSTTAANTTSRVSLQESDAMGGADFYRTPTGGMAWTTDDLVSVSGSSVIGQDIGAQLITPLNSIPDDPLFGSYVSSSLGVGGDYAMHRIAVLGQGVAQSDNRVQSVGSVTILPQPNANGTWILYGMPVTLKSGQKTDINAQITS